MLLIKTSYLLINIPFIWLICVLFVCSSTVSGDHSQIFSIFYLFVWTKPILWWSQPIRWNPRVGIANQVKATPLPCPPAQQQQPGRGAGPLLDGVRGAPPQGSRRVWRVCGGHPPGLGAHQPAEPHLRGVPAGPARRHRVHPRQRWVGGCVQCVCVCRAVKCADMIHKEFYSVLMCMWCLCVCVMIVNVCVCVLWYINRIIHWNVCVMYACGSMMWRVIVVMCVMIYY